MVITNESLAMIRERNNEKLSPIYSFRLTEFDACERLSRDIQSQIVLRNRESRLSSEYLKISAGVRFKLKQFSTEVQQLNKNLSEASLRGSM